MISNRLRRSTRWLALLAVCAVLSGCIGKSSPEVTFYSLLSLAQMDGTAATAPVDSGLRVGIGPITIPEALKRAQLVTRDARNIYRFDEYHRWAGILEKDIAYVTGDNLAGLLGTDKIAFFPWMPHFSPTHRVIIDILRFDGELSGDAVLSASWTIADATGKVTLASGTGVYRQPVTGGDYTGLVEAESRTLADLSRVLATELNRLKE